LSARKTTDGATVYSGLWGGEPRIYADRAGAEARMRDLALVDWDGDDPKFEVREMTINEAAEAMPFAAEEPLLRGKECACGCGAYTDRIVRRLGGSQRRHDAGPGGVR
jgi:hypothetical protein